MDILEKLNQDNNFFNYSFMTLEDLKRRLTFKVKQNAVLKLSDHYNIKPEIADMSQPNPITIKAIFHPIPLSNTKIWSYVKIGPMSRFSTS